MKSTLDVFEGMMLFFLRESKATLTRDALDELLEAWYELRRAAEEEEPAKVEAPRAAGDPQGPQGVGPYETHGSGAPVALGGLIDPRAAFGHERRRGSTPHAAATAFGRVQFNRPGGNKSHPPGHPPSGKRGKIRGTSRTPSPTTTEYRL